MLSDKTATPMTLSILERDLAIAQEKAHKLNNLSEVEKAVTIKDLVPDDQTEKLFLVEDLALLLGPSLGERDERVPEIDYTAGFAAIDSLIGSLADLERVVSENEAGDVRALRLAAESFRTQLDAADNQEKMALTEHLATNLLEGLDQTLGKLRLALTAEAFDIEDLPEEVLSQWKTDDGRYRVAIYPSDDLANKESEEQFVTSVRAETPEATGVPVVGIEAGKAVVGAFRQAFSIALVIVFALLVMLMRNWLDPLLIVTPVLLAALLSVGIMAFLDIPLNFANIIALPLLFGIGVDNGIHIVHRFRVALPSSGNLMATSTARAVFFGTLTTIFSFGNLAFSSHVGMATMGKLLTIGMTLTMMTTLFVLPTLLRSRQEI